MSDRGGPRPVPKRALTLVNGVRGLGLVVILATPSAAWAQTPLADLSLEDAMKLDAGQVFGASERLQPVMEAPSSVTFITAAEIARFGYRTLADILRSVRGMYVTNDRTFSLMGTRGFAKPGDRNSRILLLVNGHRVNDSVFGQAQIGPEFGIDPVMFERVEVIRGPASSLYGDSAFFAVVNVITRTGASLNSGSIALEAGTLGTQLVRAAAGRGFSNGVDVALSGTYERSDGVGRLYFPAFDTPLSSNGVADGLDGEGVRQFYGHLAFKDVTVTAAYGRRQKDVPTASFGTLFNQQTSREETFDRRSLVDAEYGHSFQGTRLTVRLSFDRFSYNGVFPYASPQAGLPLLVGGSAVLGTRWSAGSAVTRAFPGRQTVRAGVEFIDNIHQDQTAGSNASPALSLDSRRSSTQHAVYAQDEIRLARWLIVHAGLRYDGYEAFTRVTPRAALIVLPSAGQSVKYLFGSAFRAPNAFELNSFYFGAQVEKLRPESIDTHELVWERYLNNWLRTAVSTYWYRATQLITATTDDSTVAGTSFVNQGAVRARGLEVEAQMRFRQASRMLVSYAVQSATEGPSRIELPNSPRHIAKARISVPGPMPRSYLSAEGQFLSSRATLGGSRVAAAATVNGTIVQPLTRAWELTGELRNIFDARYEDPASSEHRQDAIPQNGRTARIGLRWTVWTQ